MTEAYGRTQAPAFKESARKGVDFVLAARNRDRAWRKSPAEDPLIKKGVARMLEKLPTWDANTGRIDFYYWYYGTMAMVRIGGVGKMKWNDAIDDAILKQQSADKQACTNGSWEPIDVWSEVGGRVYATAMLTLCLLGEASLPPAAAAGAKK